MRSLFVLIALLGALDAYAGVSKVTPTGSGWTVKDAGTGKTLATAVANAGECESAIRASAPPSRVSGSIQLICLRTYTVSFAPDAECPEKPPAETRTMQCEAPRLGTYGQMRDYVRGVPPACWKPTEWQNVTDPAKVCVDAPPPANTARITWNPSAGAKGYNLFIGRDRATIGAAHIVPLPPEALSYTTGPLSSGTWYFAVVAVDASGRQSGLSDVTSKVIP